MDTPPTPTNVGPDGEKILEMDYYNLLEIPGNADASAIKKAYRKQAMKWHPDKNPGNESAAVKFQEISEAYSVLQDDNLRAVYNRQGKSSAVAGAGGAEAMPDPGQMFSQMFGGKAFEDWIGEISLGKDVSKAFEMSATEEEQEAAKAALNGDAPSTPPLAGGAATSPSLAAIHPTQFSETKPVPSVSSPSIPTPAPTASSDASSPSKGSTTTSTSTESASALPPSSNVDPDKKGSVPRMTPEQRQKMELYEMKRQEEKRERLRVLISKLRDRIRPFVDASKPGEADDPETQRYITKIREQAHDLAMESFGVELSNLIGDIYMSKASSYIKLHRKATSNILGIQGFFSRVKEKGKMISEGWSFLSVGLDIQSAMADMERRQLKGEMGEDEMKQLEEDMSGKLLLVAWKGSKFELSGVLRQVVDGVLTKEDATVTDAILMNRAKAILVTGAILKSVVADDDDSERRGLERMVAEAQRKRKEKGKKKPSTSGTTTPAV